MTSRIANPPVPLSLPQYLKMKGKDVDPKVNKYLTGGGEGGREGGRERGA